MVSCEIGDGLQNDLMINKQLIRNHIERRCRGRACGTMPEFSGKGLEKQRKSSIRIARLRLDI
jgi:hypothetical protein